MAMVVVATGYGGPEVLSVVDEEPAAPGRGEVLLDVRAAGINPIDAKRYGGAFGADPGRLPLRLGVEAAGVVRSVGPDAVGPVGPVRPGDEVIAHPVRGAYAERLIVPASAVVPKPAGVSWAAAGGLLLAGVTATHCLNAVRVGRGDTVVVHGAAGGVGLLAVQLAALDGARVLATASPPRHALLRELGAEPVDYGPGLTDRLRALAPEGVAAAVDAVGTDEAVESSVELVADRDRIATIAAFRRGAELGIRLLGGGAGADPGTELRAAARTGLTDLVAGGRLRVLVAATYPLADAARAHRDLLGRHAPGKLVLLP